MKTVNWNPKEGCAFQGDIAIVAVPTNITISQVNEIEPVNGRLIIQEGEQSGHHHAIERQFRPMREVGDPTLYVRDTRLAKAFGGKGKAGTARLYHDEKAINALLKYGILTRTDLAIGFLIVEGGSVVIRHEEHNGICLPPGNYYVGRQVESAGAEERIVRD